MEGVFLMLAAQELWVNSTTGSLHQERCEGSSSALKCCFQGSGLTLRPCKIISWSMKSTIQIHSNSSHKERGIYFRVGWGICYFLSRFFLMFLST